VAGRAGLGLVLLASAVLFVTLGFFATAVAQPLPDCGSTPQGSTTPVKATVEAPASPGDLNLGRSESGERRKELEYAFSGDCVPPQNVEVHVGVFGGDGKDLASDAVTASPPAIDGNTVRVTITATRSKVDPGAYTGSIRVGNAQTGSAKTDLTIKHQQSFLPWPFVLGLIAALGGVILAGFRHLQEPEPTLGERRLQGFTDAGTASAGRRFFWWIVALAERILRALFRLLTSRDGWAALVGLGAAATAFNATYINDASWALTLSSGFALFVAVGGAALVAAFAAWQAPQSG
jgi:hypothetical protein